MDKIDELIEKAYKNNKVVDIVDILDLELTEDEYNCLVGVLELKGIRIKEETYEDNDDNINDVILSDDFKLYLKDISTKPLLTVEEERFLFSEYQKTRSEKIREKLIESNLRLVISVAKKYRSRLENNTNDLLDIIQEGNTGLIKAVEKFDANLGNKFSTYAMWWIRSFIERSLDSDGKTIRTPFSVVYTYNKIQKIKKDAELMCGKSLSEYEIAQSLGINDERAIDIIEAGKINVISANERIGEDDSATRLDYIASPGALLEEEVIDKIDFENLVNIMRSKLTIREFFVVSAKLGIVNEVNDCPTTKTLEEIGEILGVTRERIRQILLKGIKKIQYEYKRNYNIAKEERKINIR